MARKKKPAEMARTRLEFFSKSEARGRFLLELPECWEMKKEKTTPLAPRQRKRTRSKR